MDRYGKLLTSTIISLLLLNSGCGANKNEEVFNQKTCEYETKITKSTPEVLSTTYDKCVMDSPKAEAKQELEEFKGNLQHIFFHPLIIYPKMAFDGDYLSQGYDDWFVTVSEFKKILDNLYAKNFILVDIRDTYDVFEIDGKRIIKMKKLMVPKGKKPLIISIDDMNYYQYMIDNGNAHKLIIDADGAIKTYSTNEKKEKIISDDNDIVPILDKFVEQNPDFSLNGAKGIIALTGYEGVLGYRTNDVKSDNLNSERTEAERLIEKLKENGWSFASHGYGHLDTNEISFKRLEKDTLRWKNEVEPLIGPTPVYIYPFGSTVNYNDTKFKFLMDNGFDVFCGVGPETITEYKKDCILTDRRPIDGYSFHNNSKNLVDLFDCDQILDKFRPKSN